MQILETLSLAHSPKLDQTENFHKNLYPIIWYFEK